MTIPVRVRLAAARVGLAALAIALAPVAGAAQTVVGESRGTDSAFEYIGVIEQVGPALSATGYLTRVAGLTASQLFTSATTNESTATFTFVGSASLTSHVNLGNVFLSGAPGQISVYYNPTGGATFGNPASFQQGTLVARLDVRFLNSLTVIGTNLGVSTGTAHGWQSTAATFTIDSASYRFGTPGITHDMTLPGRGDRTAPAPPVATFQFSGASVTSRQAPLPPVLAPAVVNGHTVTLSWQPGEGPQPTSYTVVAAVAPGGPAVVSQPVTGLGLQVAAPSGTFYVRVRAHHEFGASELSNEVIVVVQ